MKTEQAKKTLSGLIDAAVAADERGDVVMRDQNLRTIEELPLSDAYILAALDPHGLLSVYRGSK